MPMPLATGNIATSVVVVDRATLLRRMALAVFTGPHMDEGAPCCALCRAPTGPRGSAPQRATCDNCAHAYVVLFAHALKDLLPGG